jgi:hypothetical protein
MADAKTKTVNYTAEMVDQIVSMYEELGNEGLDEIAEAVGRPVRSVRSKLVREGVYIASPKAPKAKREDGPTKKDLLNELEALVAFDVNGLMGATKAAISDVIALAQSQVAQADADTQPEVAQAE